jgi:senataxin
VLVKKSSIKPTSNEGFMRQRAAELEAARLRKAAAVEKNRKLRGELSEAGSHLKGLRTIGKDHAAKGMGIMVSSDSESEESDNYDEIDHELFPSTKSAHHPRPGRDGIVLYDLKEPIRGPLKIKRTVRSVKDMRARLAPDLSVLHKTILGWDYFHPGDYPPGASPDVYKAVPATFRAPHEYKSIFEPLLILEAWQGFVKAREETNFKAYAIKIANRASVDAFLEVSSVMPLSDNRDVQVSEGDVVLCSRSTTPATASDQPYCLARVHKVSRKKGNLEILYRILPGNKLSSWMAPEAVIWGVKIQSLVPLEREYGALQSLQYYDLCDYILQAKPSHLLEYNDKQLNPIMTNYELNKAQAKAVKSAIDNDAFTLIQG